MMAERRCKGTLSSSSFQMEMSFADVFPKLRLQRFPSNIPSQERFFSRFAHTDELTANFASEPFFVPFILKGLTPSCFGSKARISKKYNKLLYCTKSVTIQKGYAVAGSDQIC
jgi:hypothetical protein